MYEVKDEKLALQAIQAAEEKVTYRTKPALSREKIISIIRNFLYPQEVAI